MTSRESSTRNQIERASQALVRTAPEVIRTFKGWLEAELPMVKNGFVWKIPELDGFDAKRFPSSAEANVRLKYFLSEKWKSGNAKDREKIAEWIIAEWGGIRRNSEDRIKQHAKTAANPPDLLSQSGIASLSKVMSVVDPDLFAIYDARVAAALNAVQLQAKLKRGIAFRYVVGRNVAIHGSRDAKGNQLSKGFVHAYPFGVLRSRGWVVPGRGQNYWTYLGLLHACKRQLDGYKLSELEMALFRAAPTICGDLLNGS